MDELDKHDQLMEHLAKEYPEMYSEPYGGICTGEGWYPIVRALSRQISWHVTERNKTRERLLQDNPHDWPIPDYVEPVIVRQIKEKFGGLRFYYDGGDDTVDGMVRMAESWAAVTCETCGAPGHQRGGGWIRTLCDVHEEEYQQRKQKQGA